MHDVAALLAGSWRRATRALVSGRRSATVEPAVPASGQVLVLFALSLVVFLGAAALVIDYGTWLTARRDYQAVTDQASLAGVHFLVPPDNATCADYAACARTEAWRYVNKHVGLGLSDASIASYAAANSGVSGTTIGNFTVWVDTPPNAAGAAYHGNQGSNKKVLFVQISANQQPLFARVMGSNGMTISAWSTAGSFPNRWAILTLRRGKNGVDIDSGPSNATDISLKGTNSELDVVDGDVGGNYGMKLSSGSTLKIISDALNPANVYLIDYTSCGNSCWSNGQIVDGSNPPVSMSVYDPPNGAIRLPVFIRDPNYPAPTELNTNAPSGQPACTSSPCIPKAAGTDAQGDITIKNGDPGKIVNGMCPADTPILGPGWVHNINVAAGQCLILAGNVQRTNINDPLTQTWVPQTQRAGVFYVTGAININGGTVPGEIIGDGVTVFFRGSAAFTTNSGAAMDLNRGTVATESSFVSGATTPKYGAWTTKGKSSWVWDTTVSPAHYTYRQTFSPLDGRGVAVYVLKPSQYGQIMSGGTAVVSSNSGSVLAWAGVTYAPDDNVSIAGQPDHNGIGQLVSWTFTFNGGAAVTQTYDGPDEGFPVLIEPCTNGSDGACQ